MPYELRLPLVLFICVAVPCLWLIADLCFWRPWLRRSLGLLSILLSFGAAFIAGSLQILSANAYYGNANKDLIEQIIIELRKGHIDKVITVLTDLDSDFHPTYENRGKYSSLVEASTEKLKYNKPEQDAAVTP